MFFSSPLAVVGLSGSTLTRNACVVYARRDRRRSPRRPSVDVFSIGGEPVGLTGVADDLAVVTADQFARLDDVPALHALSTRRRPQTDGDVAQILRVSERIVHSRSIRR